MKKYIFVFAALLMGASAFADTPSKNPGCQLVDSDGNPVTFRGGRGEGCKLRYVELWRAARALGLKSGDVVVSVNDRPLSDIHAVGLGMQDVGLYRAKTVTVRRQGKLVTLLNYK